MRFRTVPSEGLNSAPDKREPISIIGPYMWQWLALLHRLEGRGAQFRHG